MAFGRLTRSISSIPFLSPIMQTHPPNVPTKPFRELASLACVDLISSFRIDSVLLDVNLPIHYSLADVCISHKYRCQYALHKPK